MIIKNIIIGEDIRQELGNKLSLMGILGESINIDIPRDTPKDTPVQVILSSLITIENDRSELLKEFEIEVILLLGQDQFAKMAAKIGADGNPKILHVPVPKFEFPATESVVLTINAKILKDNESISESSCTLNVNINRT